MTPLLTAAARLTRRIAVAGNPNSGKTTLFNALTGLRHKVANYPGVTVEKREGRLSGEPRITLLDLPGTYSLSARSPDEQVARDVLLGWTDGGAPPDAVLIVVDAANLERNLYLACQIIELGVPAVVACNMWDRATQRGDGLDPAALSRALGVPVIPTVATRGAGVEAVRRALVRASDEPLPAGGAEEPASPARWLPPEPYASSVEPVAAALVEHGVCSPRAAAGAALLLLGDAQAGGEASRLGRRLPPEVVKRVETEVARLQRNGSRETATAVVAARYAWIGEVVRRAARTSERSVGGGLSRADALTDRIDRIVTHRVWGLALLGGILFTLFMALFSWAEPLMRLIERGQAALQAGLRAALPAGPLADLLADGVIGGAGAVVVFFPQICFLFFFIAVLEDSGYLARAAFLMDRLMSAAGLHGKSFIPLLSSYACAVPGIMATRTIENRRDRLATILVAPLMSCSARLPVYLIVIGTVFSGGAWLKACVITAMYAVGTVTALLMAALFKRTLLAGPTPAFILELPPYHLPRPWPILRAMWDRSKLFLTRAGTVILAVCVVLWGLAYFPRDEAAAVRAAERTRTVLAAAGIGAEFAPSSLPQPAREALREIENERAGEQLRQSYLGRLGRAIEPALRPLGFDWRIGVGVLASFAAREVFVGTMGVVYNVGSAEDDEASLRARMRAARWEGGPRAGQRVYSPLVGVSLMIFYVLCCQCVSTLAVARRETNSWRWPAFMFAYMTALAYAGALVVYQVGSRLGWGL